MKPDSAWHYMGDLRSALVSAALRLVENEGAAALSLRRVAREAGVSAMAPYHHFVDRAALVAAVAEQGFDRLMAGKLAALAAAPGDPADLLVAGSAAYVRFVIDNPELYRLMKSAELADRSSHPALAAAAARPGASLADLIGRLAAEGRLHGTTPAAAAATLWGLVHGLGTLAMDGYMTDPEALARDGARAMLRGWTQP